MKYNRILGGRYSSILFKTYLVLAIVATALATLATLATIATALLRLSGDRANRTVEGRTTAIHNAGGTARHVLGDAPHSPFRMIRHMANRPVPLSDRVAKHITHTANQG
jgi:hypothetical protein